jgi:hypothetical protein
MSAKDIVLKPIKADVANAFVKKHHYSKKVVQNSQVHLGVFYFGKLEGVMSFGPSLDKSKVIGLIKDTNWNGFIELNRMAFSDVLPKNSESRAISVAIRMLKKFAPTVEWVISFADGTQSGDGTIYRASGFYLTSIRENTSLWQFPTGDRIAGMTIEANWTLPIIKKQCDFLGVEHKYRTRNDWKKLGAFPLPGFQLRYIYFINPSAKDRLTVPILPFSDIAKMGATMYKGIGDGSIDSDAIDFQSIEGSATLTPLLQPKE